MRVDLTSTKPRAEGFPESPCHVIVVKEGDIGVCGIAVLNNFSCGISVILISKCGIAVFSEPAGCGFF